MATLTTITGANYPLSGTATAATTGLSVVTSATHVGAPASLLPPGTTATGYLTVADNASFAFRVDATSVPMQANETDYWVTFWYQAATNSTTLAADQTQLLVLNIQNVNNIRTNFYVRNQTHNPGLTLDVVSSGVGGSSEGLFNQGAATGGPIIAFNRWAFICVHIKRSTAAGIFEMYVNGCLIGRRTGLSTDVNIGAAALQDVSFFLNGTNGITHRICGPFTTFDGTGPTLRPMHSLNPSTSLVTQWIGCDPATDTSNQNGKFWTYSGTATLTPTTYVAGGNSPNRKRHVWSGAASSTWNQTMIDSIGVLPWSSGGWATLVFPMIYIPNGTAQVVVRNSAGSTVLTLDITGGNLQQGGVTKAPFTQADRYAMMIHFGANGTITGSLYDLTQTNASQNAWSYSLGTWTVGALGTVTMSGVLGATSSEVDGIAVCRLATVFGPESLSNTVATTVSPNMNICTLLGVTLAEANDVAMLPDAPYNNRIYGMDRRYALLSIGRTGQTLTQLRTNVLANLTLARGLEYINLDCDTNSITSVTNDATRMTAITNWVANLQAISDLAVAGDWVFWIMANIGRVSGAGTWSTLQASTHRDFANQTRLFAFSRQSIKYHIRFTDVDAAMADQTSASVWTIPGDDVHQNLTGCGTITKFLTKNVITPDIPRLLFAGTGQAPGPSPVAPSKGKGKGK